MQADRAVAALQQFAFVPGERLEKRWDNPEYTALSTSVFGYTLTGADWLIGSEAWVGEAVRVVADGFMDNFVITYGLVFPRDGGVLFLNDVATMTELGRRLDDGLKPLAYAELLGELYSAANIDGPTVKPFSATASHRSGWLIRDVDAFRREYPHVDPSLVAAPDVARRDGQLVLEFFSHNYYLKEVASAIDVYRWVVTAPAGQPATWSRQRVAEGLERPLS
jgi:hypothetical protein